MDDIANKTIAQLRNEGYLIIAFEPWQLVDVDITVAENLIEDYGNNVLDAIPICHENDEYDEKNIASYVERANYTG